MILCWCNGVKYRNIAFKPIFSPVERTKTGNGIVVGCQQNKRSDGLKNELFDFSVNFCL